MRAQCSDNDHMSRDFDSVSPARLLIADDHDLIREGISTMLAKEEDLEVVGEAENGREAVELCRKFQPDLVLMDVRMPEMDGLGATRAIKADHPEISILVVTTHASTEYLLEAIEAGAAGYVLKDASKRQLIAAVRRTLTGETALNQDLAMGLLKRLAGEGRIQESPHEEPRGSVEQPIEPLTPREVEILRLLADGLTNPEIARHLVVSTGTVKNHVQHVIRKLGVSDRTQAAVRGMELGLISSR